MTPALPAAASKIIRAVSLAAAMTLLVSACSAEVGSETWCNNMKEKPKGDWTANEAGDYTKNCLFK